MARNPGTTNATMRAAPDKQHAKVIVHWDDGRMENLGKQIPMDELIRHAEYLEVKEVKRVHWAA
ncbi:hypothetical protein ACHAPQ_010091 [Fusarium lateritium]